MKKYAAIGVLLLVTPAQAQTPDDHKRLASAGIELLNRTQITGSEAEIMFRVRAMLGAIAQGQLTLVIPRPQSVLDKKTEYPVENKP